MNTVKELQYIDNTCVFDLLSVFLMIITFIYTKIPRNDETLRNIIHIRKKALTKPICTLVLLRLLCYRFSTITRQ